MSDDEQQIDDDDSVLADGGPLDVPAGAVVTQAPVPIIAEQELDFEEGEVEDLDLPDFDAPVLAHAEDPRVAKLEATVQQLTSAEVTREQRRVRRKVKAATGGAGIVGFIPILLQLVGALDVDPEVASAIAAVAAAAGALIAGWATPERSSAILAEVIRTTKEVS